MTRPPAAYLEHVAISVRDIRWHIAFFAEVFGLGMREVDGTVENPHQYWTLGGLQLISDPDYDGAGGRLGHLGLMCADLESAITASLARGAQSMPRGRNWLRLPEGLVLELMQADPPGAVAQALAVDARTGS
jgi:catechol 2,3-dioxygenase-like lactoylglutathione lyase family enzyme